MDDPRISHYKQVAEKMARGEFRVRVPLKDRGDEIDQLGMSLVHLGETLDHRFHEIRKLAAVTEKINAGLLLDEVLDFVYDEFRAMIPYDRIGFSLLESRNQMVVARWARSEAPHMEITRGYAARLAGSSLQTILDTGQPRIINDLQDYLRDHPESESTQRIVREGMRSSLTCPLIALNKPVGFMFFSSMQPGTYRDAHCDIFLRIASQLSVIVEKSRLYQDLLELHELKNRFLGMAAHDLRNPLCVMRAYLELLLGDSNPQLTAEKVTALAFMNNACDVMISMVETFLDISAIEAGQLILKPKPVKVGPFLAEIARNACLLSQAKDISIRLHIDDQDLEWVFDPHRITQVLQNLISNAWKFSDPGTEIRIRAGLEHGQLRLAVADQGRGIPEEDIPKLFKEFGRTRTQPTAGEPSLGLGLAICRRIVELHNGTLTVESKVGQGSTFTMMLP